MNIWTPNNMLLTKPRSQHRKQRGTQKVLGNSWKWTPNSWKPLGHSKSSSKGLPQLKSSTLQPKRPRKRTKLQDHRRKKITMIRVEIETAPPQKNQELLLWNHKQTISHTNQKKSQMRNERKATNDIRILKILRYLWILWKYWHHQNRQQNVEMYTFQKTYKTESGRNRKWDHINY